MHGDSEIKHHVIVHHHGDDYATCQLQRLHQAFALVKHNTQLEWDHQKRLYDRQVTPPKLKIGDNVWYYLSQHAR